MSRTETSCVSERESSRGGGLISILEEIQSIHGYLPVEELRRVAATTGKPLVDIYGVATFFRAFSLTPRGKHLVSVCLGTACHVRGGPAVAKEMERQLGVKAGETTPDREFTFEAVNCLGACALGPVVVVDGHYFSKVKPVAVKHILQQTRSGLEAADIRHDQRVFPLDITCTRCNHPLMDDTRLVDDRASVGLIVTTPTGHGQLHLSSYYGSNSFICDLDIPQGAVTDLVCPRCQTSLVGRQPCAECGAPVASLFVDGGAVLQVCSRRGCLAHMLDLIGVNLWSGAAEQSSNSTPCE